MRCLNSMKCNKDIKLHQKDPKAVSSSFSISNWTKHVRSCFDKSSVERHDNQPLLKSCFFHLYMTMPQQYLARDNFINLTDSSDMSSNIILVNFENESQNVESYREVKSSPLVNAVNSQTQSHKQNGK